MFSGFAIRSGNPDRTPPVCIILTATVICLFAGQLSAEGITAYSCLDSSWVDTVYSLVRNDQMDSAVRFIKGLGDENSVVRIWLDIQRDIFSVKRDAHASAAIGRIGAEYAVEKGYIRTAAVMLHNICSFMMPEFDEGIDAEDHQAIIDAARRQVELRRRIRYKSKLVWALWDLGIARLSAGHADEAIKALSEGEKLSLDQDEAKAAAWCRIFIGKTKVKYMPDREFEGERDMLEAARIIRKTGKSWEKEAVGNILKSVYLE